MILLVKSTKVLKKPLSKSFVKPTLSTAFWQKKVALMRVMNTSGLLIPSMAQPISSMDSLNLRFLLRYAIKTELLWALFTTQFHKNCLVPTAVTEHNSTVAVYVSLHEKASKVRYSVPVFPIVMIICI